MRAEPVVAALDSLRRPESTRHPPRPGGRGVPPRARAATWPARTHLILVCPRYEGVDERIRALVDLELSIGDYVADRRRAAGARRDRRGHPAAARRHRRPVDRRGVVQRRAARVPAVHAPAVVPRRGRSGDPASGRPRRRRGAGARSRRPRGRATVGRTCCREQPTSRPERRLSARSGRRIEPEPVLSSGAGRHLRGHLRTPSPQLRLPTDQGTAA